MKYKKIVVTNPRQNETIYTYLKELRISERYISFLRQKTENILLNGQNATTRTKVKQGDVIEINQSPNAKTSILENNIPLDIVFEDENMLVVNKPANLSCMPNKLHYEHNLAGAIVAYMKKQDEHFVLRIINRLDKDTQGLILVCKNAFAYSSLFSSVKKVYHAVVCGKIEKPFEIEKPIETLKEQDGRNVLKRVVSQTGKIAITKVTPLKTDNNVSLIKLELEHGRTHQIRVHLSYAQHALVGDEIYGTKSNLISHTALVCKEMSVVNPTTNQVMNFEIDYANDFKTLINSID